MVLFKVLPKKESFARCMVLRTLFLLFILLVNCTGLYHVYGLGSLKQLIPDFDYWEWYNSATKGWDKDENFFGAWAIETYKETVYIGFNSSGPSWNGSDGALLTRVRNGQIEILSPLDEQGIHIIFRHKNILYIPGTDPHFADDWDAGNFYRYIIPGEFTKYRYDKNGNPYLPNVNHLMGIYVEPETGYIYTSGSGPDEAYFFKSTDMGETWRITIVPIRFDRIIKYNGMLYGLSVGGHFREQRTSSIKFSMDDGKTWQELKYEGKPIENMTDFTIFKGILLLLTDLT